MSSRKEAWLSAIGVVVAVLFAAGLWLYSFLNSLTTTLYRDPQDVPSATQSTPLPEWAGAAEQARQIARASVVEHNLPGLSVAVGVGRDLVWAEGFGWADIEKRIPVTPDSRFRLGHASIPLTSAAVGLLLEKDRLRFGDGIQKYVPTFPHKRWPITLRQLMAHTAGVRHYRDEADYMPTAHCERASEGLQSFANDPLLFEPETQYQYSTFGWILVSAAVEAAAGEPFFAYMHNKIFMPLGMSGTTADSGSEPVPNRATFYYPRFSGDPAFGPKLATAVDYSCFAGAGGFLSTPSDLVRFGVALNTGKLLDPATVRKLQRRQLLTSGAETDYGLGWMLENVTLTGEPTPVAGHASRTPLGGSTTFMMVPERDLVVAMTSNISDVSTKYIAIRIADVFAARQKGQ
jgi:serine beta-lactamase-like protein LACTB, mitochondrial